VVTALPAMRCEHPADRTSRRVGRDDLVDETELNCAPNATRRGLVLGCE
jgi:hypothetical protein